MIYDYPYIHPEGRGGILNRRVQELFPFSTPEGITNAYTAYQANRQAVQRLSNTPDPFKYSTINPDDVDKLNKIDVPETGNKLNWGGIAQAAGGAAAMAMPRKVYDDLDPMFHLAGGRHSAFGNGLSDAGVSLFKSGAASGNPQLMLAGGIVKAAGGLFNAGFGYNIENEQAVRDNIGKLASVKFNARDMDTLASQYGSANMTRMSLGGVKNGWFNRTGTKKANELSTLQNNLYDFGTRSFGNALGNIGQETKGNFMRNYFDLGGPLYTMGMAGEAGPATAFDLASRYLRTKEMEAQSKNKLTGISPASPINTLALGGDVQIHGGDFTTGISRIDSGGAHETNPNEGVQIGVDPEGNPNLVEEGEVIYNDFVYSNRIELDDEAKEAFHFPKKKDLTYAEAAKKLEKEASERPNDPISQAALEKQMDELAQHQERQKQEMEAKRAQEAFEALSPEEQAALLQQIQQAQEQQQAAAQEQAMQQQAMQEQAMAQQQGMVSPEQQQALQLNGMEMPQTQVPSEEDMVAQQVAEARQAPSMAYGGKVNRFDDGGELKKKIYKLLGAFTNGDFIKWLNDKKLKDLSDVVSKDINSVNWEDIYRNEGFIDALRKDNPALAHAFSNGYNLMEPTLEELEDMIQSINRGNWKEINGKGWLGSTDDAFLQATKGMSEADIAKLSTEDLAKLMRETDAYKNTTKWLQNEDNALKYLNAVLESDAPDAAKKHALQFVKDGKWINGVNHDYDTVFGRVRGTNPGTYWHSVKEASRGNKTINWVQNENGDWEQIEVDIPSDWKLANQYSWKGDTDNMVYNYYQRPGAAGTTTTENGKGTGEEGKGKKRTIVPVTEKLGLKDYAKAALPNIVGLGLMTTGVGRPNFRGLDAAMSMANAPVELAFNKPFGNYAKEKPTNPFFYTSPIIAKSNAAKRTFENSINPSKDANILANTYDTMIALGSAAAQANDNDYKNYLTVNQTNNALDQANASAVNQTSQFNANALNAHNQYVSNLKSSLEQAKLEHNAGWYNSLYGNVSGGLEAAKMRDKEARTHTLLAELAATGAFNILSPDTAFGSNFVKYADDTAAYGGKINRKKKNKRRGGLTF